MAVARTGPDQIKAGISSVLLIGLLPLSLICAFIARLGDARAIEDYFSFALLHWPPVLPFLLVIPILDKQTPKFF
ncbi:MAG: hypothetical protein ACAI44_40060, partial [Candidatus Sericytochromatia bacterium]